VTINLDLLGRVQLKGGKLALQTTTFGPGSFDLLLPLSESLKSVSFAPGVKWNIAGNVLFTGSMLTALANDGLRANFVPMLGLEAAF
jgi:hypothetical protein